MVERELHPPHSVEDGRCFFLTASTVGHSQLLGEGHRVIVRDQARRIAEKHHLTVSAWVVLADHYHLLIHAAPGAEVPRFIQRFHAATALRVNGLDGRRGRKVWYQYWDTTVASEDAFWACMNYIHINPLKHGLVRWRDPGAGDVHQSAMAGLQASDVSANELLAGYAWSSYAYYLRTYGEEFLADLWRRYPVPRHMLGDAG